MMRSESAACAPDTFGNNAKYSMLKYQVQHQIAASLQLEDRIASGEGVWLYLRAKDGSVLSQQALPVVSAISNITWTGGRLIIEYTDAQGVVHIQNLNIAEFLSTGGLTTLSVGSDNQILSPQASAFGGYNIAGLRGFLIQNIQPLNGTWQEDTKANPALITLEEQSQYTAQMLAQAILNKPISMRGGYNGSDVGLVELVSQEVSHLVLHTSDWPTYTDPYSGQIFVRGLTKAGNVEEGACVWFFDEPQVGCRPLQAYQHAQGASTKAESYAAHSEGYATIAGGRYSHAQGKGTRAGYSAHAEGSGTKALGQQSHAQGTDTQAIQIDAHAQGKETTAAGQYSHAEGCSTTSSAAGAHAEGRNTAASGDYSHAEGYQTVASNTAAHAQGASTKATGPNSHAEGKETVANGDRAHAEGFKTEASGLIAHAEGQETVASSKAAHAEGESTTASGERAHAQGYGTVASGMESHAEGNGTVASGSKAHAEGSSYSGISTTASGQAAHAEGQGTTARGAASHSEGRNTKANGDLSHAEGNGTEATSQAAHAEGKNTKALKIAAHAEGQGTQATADYTHAEGTGSKATATGAHAEGSWTSATAAYAHAEGASTIAAAKNSHAEGKETYALGQDQHVQGRYNKTDSSKAHIVGSGTSVNDRKNIHVLDWNGNAYFAGDVYVQATKNATPGCTDNTTKLATQQYVSRMFGQPVNVDSIVKLTNDDRPTGGSDDPDITDLPWSNQMIPLVGYEKGGVIALNPGRYAYNSNPNDGVGRGPQSALVKTITFGKKTPAGTLDTIYAQYTIAANQSDWKFLPVPANTDLIVLDMYGDWYTRYGTIITEAAEIMAVIT